MDGTFDQLRPLDLLAGYQGACHSVDFQAATDRWPLFLLFDLFATLFDRSLASAVVNSALAFNSFLVPFVKRERDL